MQAPALSLLFAAALSTALLLAAPSGRAADASPAPAASAEEGPVRRQPDKPPVLKGKAVTVNLAITGMTCGGCAESIARLLTTIDGVVFAEVDLAAKRGQVQFDDARVTPERLIAKIKANGYGATVMPGS